MTTLAVTRHDDADGVIRLCPVGDLDYTTGEHLAATVRRTFTTDRPTSLVIDLDGVTFLDSVGMSVLVAAQRLAADHGATCQVTNPQPLRPAHPGTRRTPGPTHRTPRLAPP